MRFNFSYGAGVAWLVPMETGQVADCFNSVTKTSSGVSGSGGSGACSGAWKSLAVDLTPGLRR